MSDQYTLEDREEAIHLKSAWGNVLSRLAKEVPSNVMERFLKLLRPEGIEGHCAVFAAPSAFVLEWVRDKYQPKLQRLLGEELGHDVVLDLKLELREKPVEVPRTVVLTTPAVVETPKFVPIEKYGFDNFIIGQSNRLAVAGARAVAQAPGQIYNPLFIYGSSGLGKTHLMHAIAKEILRQDPNYPLTYVSAQQFVEEFVHAMQNNRIDQFRKIQRGIGLWLVDDIQFIVGKDKTQEEVFHTFNHLHQMGKQIVLCSDRPPKELYLMDERLRSRFESGLVADIQLPDTETRCAILLSKARQQNVPLDHDIAMFLAENVPGNVRILEGALIKVTAHASVEGRAIDRELCEMLIEKHYRGIGLAKPSFNQILELVGKHYNIPVTEIRGVSRKAPIAHARHVAVYITREITRDSWKHIGGLFGDRDHTSMMHAYQKISEMMARDHELNGTIKLLIRNLFPEI